MKTRLLLSAILLCAVRLFAVNPPMDACVDSMEVTYTLSDKGKARIYCQASVSIYSKAGSDAGLLNIFISNNTTLKYFKAEIYDANNRKVKDVYQQDLLTTSGYDQSTLYADTRRLSYHFQSKSYPFRFEYAYEFLEDPFIAGLWQVSDQYNLSIRKAILHVISPEDFRYSWRQINIPEEPLTRQEGRKIIRTWKVGEFPALKKEPFSPDLHSLQPTVFITPSTFTLEGYTCRNDSWKTSGSWVSALLENRQKLSEEMQVRLNTMVAGIPSKVTKARKIYEYFRSTTRYVSVQEGIGGFQPVPAREVEKTGYGDCKGLANYLKAMYDCVGLDAFYTEIGSGNSTRIFWPDFPNEYCTNHVILMMPNQPDTLWIECTDPSLPFAYPGEENLDRYALVVLPGFGKIVKTPDFSGKRNFQVVGANSTVHADGEMHLDANYRIDGILMEDWLPLQKMKPDEQLDWYRRKTEMPDLILNRFMPAESSRAVPDLKVVLDADCPAFLNSTGSTSLRIHFLNRLDIPQLPKTRQSPLSFPQAIHYIDSLNLTLDSVFRIQFIPPDVVLQSPFGSYLSQCSHQNNTLIITRKITFNKGLFPKEDYPELQKFYDGIRQAENQMIVVDRN